MNAARQIWAVSTVALETLPQRLGSSTVLIVSIAATVAVLVTVLAIARDLEHLVLVTGHEDRAIVLHSGATMEAASALSADTVAQVLDAPGIARAPDGTAIAGAEVVTSLNLKRKSDGLVVGLSVRGVAQHPQLLRPEIQLVRGRLFRPGLRELLVGSSTQSEFRGVEIGDQVILRDARWTVVGAYVSDDSLESALIADGNVLRTDLQRSGANSVTVRLESPGSLQVLLRALADSPQLSVKVVRESDYYRSQSESATTLLFAVTYFVITIMAAGTLLAAANAMYLAVNSRVIEIATFRAVGFASGAVVLSVLLEAVVLSLPGAGLAAVIAWLLYGGHLVAIGDELSMFVVRLRMPPDLFAEAALLAIALGLIGAIVPAIQSVRSSVAAALHES